MAMAALGCRQLVGIDDDRPLLPDDASSGDEAGAVDGGGADRGAPNPGDDGSPGGDGGANADGGVDGAQNDGQAEEGGDGGVLACKTTGTADRRFVQWTLPPVIPPETNYVIDASGDTVLDKVTGLMWERKTSWPSVDPANAQAHCATLTAGGFKDWRIPTRIEALSILDYSQSYLLNPKVVGSQDTDALWTSSTLDVTTPTLKEGTFTIDLGLSFTSVVTASQVTDEVICVRSGCVAGVATRFVVGSQTARDAVTRLTWQRKVSATTMALADASAYCETFSGDGITSGWRVPTIRELASLFDETLSTFPLIDTAVFSTGNEVWSSTPAGPDVYTMSYADPSNDYILHESPCQDATCSGDTPFPVRCVHDP
jgi:hypothetical protein